MMLKIAPGRFINSEKLISANVYEKEQKIRVALTVDTVVKEEQTKFSEQFKDAAEAEAWIVNLMR